MLARNVTVDDMKRMGMPVSKGDTMSPATRSEEIGPVEIEQLKQILEDGLTLELAMHERNLPLELVQQVIKQDCAQLSHGFVAVIRRRVDKLR